MRRVVLLAVALGVLKLAVLFDRASLTVQFLAAAGLVTAWLASLYFKPFGACWRCGGRGNIVRKGKRKAPKCWACKGIGRRQRRSEERRVGKEC